MELKILEKIKEYFEEKLDDSEENIRKEKLRLIKDKIGTTDPYWFHFSYEWECKNSPTKYCVYNDVEDAIHDFCIYCGEPEERK